jgi:hypothetical protein
MSSRRTSNVLALALALAGCSGGAYSQGPSDTLRDYAGALQERRVDDAYRLLSDDAKRTMSIEAFRRMVAENPDDVLEVARALARPASDPIVSATVTLPNGDELDLVFEDGRWRVNAAAIDLYGQGTPRQALAGFLRAFERKRYDVVLRYVPDADREGVVATVAGPVAADMPAPAASAAPAASPLPAPPALSSAPPAPTAPPVAPGPKPSPDSGELTAEKLRAAWEGPQKKEMLEIVQALRAALPTATIEETGDVATMAYGSGGTVSFIRERGAWKIRDF